LGRGRENVEKKTDTADVGKKKMVLQKNSNEEKKIKKNGVKPGAPQVGKAREQTKATGREEAD